MSSEKTLLDVTSLIADCPHSTPEWTTAGVVVLRNQHIKAGRLQLNAPSYTDEKHYLQRVRRAKPTYKDIVLTREAPIGQVCQVPKGLKCCLGQRQVLIRADIEKIDADFLFYSLRAPFMQRQMLLIEGEGTTVSNLRIPYIEKLKLTIPAPETQRNVVKLLNAIEGEMETLERQNTALESIAQALFRSWFVDFDPVHAKAAGNAPEAMSSELAELFPSEFENSELGLVPKGWPVTPFSQAVAIHSGGTPKTSVLEYWGGDIPWFSVTDAPSHGQVFVLTTEKKITKEGLTHSPTKLLPRRATIISARGTVGKIGMVEGPMTMNQSCYALTPKQVAGEYWVYFETRRLVTQLKQMAHGGVFDTITKGTFDGVTVVTPSDAIQRHFSQVCQPIFDTIANNGRLVASLAQLRDHLLPRLISGKLRFEDAEASVAAITSGLEAEPA